MIDPGVMGCAPGSIAARDRAFPLDHTVRPWDGVVVPDTRSLYSKLITAAGGSSLDAEVSRLRADGLGWRRISAELTRLYDITIPRSTLFGWYGEPTTKENSQ